VITLLNTGEWNTNNGVKKDKPHFQQGSYICKKIAVGKSDMDGGFELVDRIANIADLINTTTIASCAKNLAFKSVESDVHNQGVFHIEISSGRLEKNEKNGELEFENGDFKDVVKLILPAWYSDVHEEINHSHKESEDLLLDKLDSDTAVIDSIER
jgi:hypothetical protein